MSWKTALARILDPESFIKHDERRVDMLGLGVINKGLNTDITNLRSDISNYRETIKNMRDKELSVLDKHCRDVYEEVPIFAYKDKRVYMGKKYAVYPNEMIDRSSYARKQALKAIGALPNDLYLKIEKKAKYVDKKALWTSDPKNSGLIDYYNTLMELLLEKHKDCEDHAFALASLDDNVGVCFGYANDMPHAFNCFIYNDKLYIVETNSVYDKNNNVFIKEYSNQEDYEILWIFTDKHTYKVGEHNTHFGVIAK